MNHASSDADASLHRRRGRRISVLALSLISGLALAACGSSSSSSSSSSAPASSASTTSSSSAAGGSAKTLTLGTKDFAEEYILGQLYKQVLEAKGYTVNYKQSVGATEIADKALSSGQIDAYPEYTGESVATVAKINTTVTSAQQEYSLAQAFYAKRGQVMSEMTPFFDTDRIATTKAYAQQHGLKTMTDLKKLAHWTVGARPEFQGRQQGAAGMMTVYGLHNFTFKSLAFGLQYQALDNGNIQGADVFSTDPQLGGGKYTVLADPKNLFGFQNIALVISKTKLAALGGDQFLSIINSLNKLLTTPAVIAMNKAVTTDKQPPATVAKSFLQANHLL